MCPTIRRRAPRHSSAFVLRSQRHRPRQRIGPPPLLMARTREQPMSEVYFDPKRVGSYGGVDALRRVTRVPRKIVAEWLWEQDAYTLHKPARRHFKRRRVIVGGIHQQWQADLVDMSKLKKDNEGMTFLLTVIDVFSKVAWCVPMKTSPRRRWRQRCKPRLSTPGQRRCRQIKAKNFLINPFRLYCSITTYITSPRTTRRRRRASWKDSTER